MLHVWLLITSVVQLIEIDLFDSDLVVQSCQIVVISLSVIGETICGDHMMCSEFIRVVRDQYQLSVISAQLC